MILRKNGMEADTEKMSKFTSDVQFTFRIIVSKLLFFFIHFYWQ